MGLARMRSLKFFLLPFTLLWISPPSSFAISSLTNGAYNFTSLVLNRTRWKEDIERFMSLNVDTSTLPTPDSPFSFGIYHGDLFIKSKYKDYESLVRARIASEEARIKQKGYGRRAQQSGTPYRAPVFDKQGAYIALVSIGTPIIRSELLIDTGSEVIWWHCHPCTNCTSRKYLPLYDPLKSSSYRHVGCAAECDTRSSFIDGCDFAGKNCQFSVKYVDGSSVSGIMAYERMTNLEQPESPIMDPLFFGCAHEMKSDIPGDRDFSGIMGIDRGPHSLVSQVKAQNFTMCLPSHRQDIGSEMRLHHIPDEYPAETITVPILHNKYDPLEYYVGLNGISVGGKKLPIPDKVWQFNGYDNGGSLFDTGAGVTWFHPTVYNELRDAFKRLMDATDMFDSYGKVGMFDTCYKVAAEDDLGHVPSVAFHFIDASDSYSLTIDHIFESVDKKEEIYCLYFGSNPSQMTILGNWQFQRTQLAFDLAKGKLHISENMCK